MLDSTTESDVTRLLDAAATGHRLSAIDLFPLVYAELRSLAAARISTDAFGHTFDADAVAMDDALARFAAVDPQTADLVTLRYFGGLTIQEAAATLGRTTDRLWAFARAWLSPELAEKF